MITKEIVCAVLTKEAQTQKEIVEKLKEYGITISERKLRIVFHQINDDFINGEFDSVIISNRSGSYISNNEIDIRLFNENKIKHAKSELYSAYNVNKRIEKNKNLSFRDYIKEEFGKNDIFMC